MPLLTPNAGDANAQVHHRMTLNMTGMAFATRIHGQKFGDPGHKTMQYFHNQVFFLQKSVDTHASSVTFNSSVGAARLCLAGGGELCTRAFNHNDFH